MTQNRMILVTHPEKYKLIGIVIVAGYLALLAFIGAMVSQVSIALAVFLVIAVGLAIPSIVYNFDWVLSRRLLARDDRLSYLLVPVRTLRTTPLGESAIAFRPSLSVLLGAIRRVGESAQNQALPKEPESLQELP